MLGEHSIQPIAVDFENVLSPSLSTFALISRHDKVRAILCDEEDEAGEEKDEDEAGGDKDEDEAGGDKYGGGGAEDEDTEGGFG